MNKSFSLKLLGALGGVVLALTACGGGGGDPGTPLVPPTAKLIMTPNIGGMMMVAGRFYEPVKISGGQGPYYVGSTTNGVIPRLLDDGTLYLQAVAPTSGSPCSPSSSGSSGSSGSSATDYVWVQDSSYNQTQLQFNICVDSALPLSSSLGSSTALTLSPGNSQTFTVYGGTAPYMAISNNPAVASVSVSGASGAVTITAGYTTGNTTITVTDAAGSSLTVTVDNAVSSALAVSPATLSGAMGNVMSLSVVGGAAPYMAVSSNPDVATVSVSGSLASVSLIGAGLATITIRDATNATVTATVTVAGTFAVIPPTQLLAEGATVPISFSLVNGTGPFYVSMPTSIGSPAIPTSSLISVSPMAITNTSTPVQATLTAACIASSKTIPLTVTDSATGKTATATIQIQDTDPSNDSTPGCL